MENPENLIELEFYKPFYKWIKNNNKFLTLSSFIILFFWYLNPVIKESRFKNMCAFNTARIAQYQRSNKKSSFTDKKRKELGEKFGLVDADWKDINRFCQFYKSSERYIDADIDGNVRTYPYR